MRLVKRLLVAGSVETLTHGLSRDSDSQSSGLPRRGAAATQVVNHARPVQRGGKPRGGAGRTMTATFPTTHHVPPWPNDPTLCTADDDAAMTPRGLPAGRNVQALHCQ